MKLAVVILVLLGCLAAAAAATLAGMIPGMRPEDKVEVLVAVEDLPPLLEIEISHVKKIKVAKAALADRQGYLVEPLQAVGGILAKTVSEGQILTTSCFLSKEQAEQFSLEIPKGMTASTVSLPSNSVVSTLLYPHCRVDIYGIFNLRNRSEGDARAREILQAIEVLAVGYRHEHSGEAADDSQSRRSSTVRVTFALAPDQVKALQLTRSQGDIYITLRNPRDLEIREPRELYIAGGEIVGTVATAGQCSESEPDHTVVNAATDDLMATWLIQVIEGPDSIMVPFKRNVGNPAKALDVNQVDIGRQ